MKNANTQYKVNQEAINSVLTTATELIAISEQTINNETIQTVNARDLHEFLEVGKVFGAWINDRINQYGFVENQDYILLSNFGNQKGSGGHNRKEYYISIDMAKELSMVERNEKGKQARRYFIECEKQAKLHLPNFDNPALAARAWAEEYEKRQIAEQQAQYALETKAWISDKKTATAMNTASIKSKENEKLKQQLDQSKTYATIKRMQMLYHGLSFNWRELKSTSKEMGILPIDVHDQNYGTVKAYHRDVWLECYALDF